MNMKQKFNGSCSNGSELIKPEHMLLNVWYSITINPSTTYNELAHDDIEHYLTEVIKDQRDIMYKYSSTINMILWLELSSTLKLHYHGLIKYSNFLSSIIFQRELSKSNHVNIDTISDIMEWQLYCSKNSQLMTQTMLPRILSTSQILEVERVKAREREEAASNKYKETRAHKIASKRKVTLIDFD